MTTLKTKEVAPALGNLLKAKGQRNTQEVAVVRPSNTVMEKPSATVSATTPEPAPEPVVPATPEVQPPAPSNDGRGDYKDAYKHLKTKYDTTVSDLRNEVSQLNEKLAKATAPQVVVPKTKEELKAFRDQYGDAFDTIKTVVIEEIQENNKVLKTELEEIRKTQAEIRDREAFAELLKEHPDAFEIRNSEKFKEWFEDQPIEIQNILANSKNIKAVSKQLALYKLEVLGINPKEKKKEETKETIDASLGVNVKTRTEITAQKKIWTASEIRNICADYKLWNKHREEIDIARMEGRVDETK